MKLTIRAKLSLSIFLIASVLLVSCIILFIEYDRMSNYVSSLIADDIESVNEAGKLAAMCNDYNLEILSVVGDASSQSRPEFDDSTFRARCATIPGADSLLYSYSAYMLTSLELEDVLQSDFIDTRSWYFERLQPRYGHLHADFEHLTDGIQAELRKNSASFDRGIYRSIVPGIVAVVAGILLCVMLLFFLLSGYVEPLEKMLRSLSAYRTTDKNYNFEFEGDDELRELNDGISEIVSDNQLLRRRIASLRGKLDPKD